MQKTKVGILGATGMVGQRFIELLEEHPWFEITELGASERSAGKSYIEATEGKWKMNRDIPKKITEMNVKECNSKNFDCELVFSALDSSVAGPIEKDFAEAGFTVCSNSKNHRFDADVPLLIPEINPEHLKLLEQQKWKGKLITNPNCTSMGPCLVMKALDIVFGVEKAVIVSMQALSGAGYPGVPSIDIIDNILPYIGGEEPKVETEPLKILGKFNGKEIENAKMIISAHCNRVAVRDSHLCSISLELKKNAEIQEAVEAMENFKGLPQKLKLPSAPEQPVIVRKEEDRPQPIMDRNTGKGMAAVVGRVRECPVLGIKLDVLSHNTIRGAAGAAILNAELMKAQKIF